MSGDVGQAAEKALSCDHEPSHSREECVCGQQVAWCTRCNLSLCGCDASQELVEGGVRPWRPGDGDSRCQECGYAYDPWFTDHWLWNRVVGGPDATDDPGGYLCARCFTTKAGEVFGTLIWRVYPEWMPPPLSSGQRADS